MTEIGAGNIQLYLSATNVWDWHYQDIIRMSLTGTVNT